MRISRHNLRESPHIAAYHIWRRYTLFRDHVLVPKYAISRRPACLRLGAWVRICHSFQQKTTIPCLKRGK
jgi:hypothetical protein